MSYEMGWRIHIKNLCAPVGIGIHEHEKVPQRIIVNSVIEGLYPARPESIDQCFNYDHVHRLVVKEWPKRKHVALLETLAYDFLDYVFRIDERITNVSVTICKPDIFAEAESVGVEAVWTRADFQRLTALKS